MFDTTKWVSRTSRILLEVKADNSLEVGTNVLSLSCWFESVFVEEFEYPLEKDGIDPRFHSMPNEGLEEKIFRAHNLPDAESLIYPQPVCPFMDEALVEEWNQSPRGMMNYFQASKHTFGESIADLIDNALDAGAGDVVVDVSRFGEEAKPYIAIFDDGSGMDKDNLQVAMNLAEQRPGRPEEDLGLFGIGMKISSLAQANEVTVVSRPKGSSDITIRRISANHVKEKDVNEVLRFPTGSEIWNHVKRLFLEDGWSTILLLEDLHKVERRLDSPGRRSKNTFREELDRLEVHLGLTYERVLLARPDLNLTLDHNGSRIRITPLDPFLRAEKDIRFGSVQMQARIETTYEDRDYPIKVTYHILPHRKRREDGRFRIDEGYKKANDMQGVYYYRNNRLIKYGGWEGLFGDANDEHDKLAKIEVEVPSHLHQHFGLDPNKTSFELPGDFASRLEIDARTSRVWGQIAGGTKKSFMDAAQYRYRNDGKKTGAGGRKPTRPTGWVSSSPSGSAPTINPPAVKGTKGTKPSKPQGVVVDISEQPDVYVVRIDRQRAGATELIQILREWTVE